MNEIWILEETDTILGDNFDEFIAGKRCFLSREKAIKFMENFCIKLIYDNESDLADYQVFVKKMSTYNNENGSIDQWLITFKNSENEFFTTFVRLENFKIER